MLETPLTILQETATKHPTALAYKIPIVDPETDEIKDWKPITYSEFASDVERLAGYWARTLTREGVSQESVVAVCLGGYEYLDAVHFYSITRAGYIPHAFSRLPGIEIVKDLLRESDTRALIRAPSFREVLKDIKSMPVYDTVTSLDFEDAETIPNLPPIQSPQDPEGIGLISHTSGSTSGRSKLVRGTHRWVDSAIQKGRVPIVPRPANAPPPIGNWLGNMCHVAQYILTIQQTVHIGCIIQPKNVGDVKEYIEIVKRASANQLYTFSPYLVKLLQMARSDPDVLTLLSGLEVISGVGAMFPKSEEDFILQNDINVIGAFASTETGMQFFTKGTRYDPTNAFQVLDVPGLSYRFDPILPGGQGNLFELIVLSDSIDCPRPEFCADDGHFHTGDLWEKVEIGYYYRGREDDFIKTESALRCDTKNVESFVRRTCGDLISECVVVGYGRPAPTLFVETAFQKDVPEDDLKRSIFERIEVFNSRQMAHEKIASTDFIVVAPPNTLPRTETKGNIRRKAVEELFREKLDLIYGVKNYM